MKVYPRTADRIAARTGETFAIELEAMPAAGYEWEATWDPGLLDVVKKVEIRHRTAMGAAATERFLVTPRARGEAMIEMTYRQPWSGGATGDVYVVHVSISGTD